MTPCALGPEPLQLWKYQKLMAGRDPNQNLIHCRASQAPCNSRTSSYTWAWRGGRKDHPVSSRKVQQSTDLVCEHSDRQNDLTSLT